MDTIAIEAIANLTTAMRSLLPPTSDPALAMSVLVTPQRVGMTGLGGYVGNHPAPQGEVHGRRIAARVIVNVAATDVAGLDLVIARTTQAVMTTGREELAALGFLRLAFVELGPRPTPAPGPPRPQRQDLTFDVLYEFLKLPDVAGGVIDTIPLDLESTLAANDPRTLRKGEFPSSALDAFDVFDDPAATIAAPSSWSFAAADNAITQTSAIHGGPEGPAPEKPGTSLVLRATPTRPAITDLTMAATMRSDAVGGLGFVFRFVDLDNYSFAILDSRAGFRRIARKSGGTFVALAEGGLDDTRGYATGTLMRLRLVAQQDEVRLVLDGETILEGRDTAPPVAGRVGFLTRNCTGARFFDLTLVRL